MSMNHYFITLFVRLMFKFFGWHVTVSSNRISAISISSICKVKDLRILAKSTMTSMLANRVPIPAAKINIYIYECVCVRVLVWVAHINFVCSTHNFLVLLRRVYIGMGALLIFLMFLEQIYLD